MNRWKLLAAAVALTAPIVTFGQDKPADPETPTSSKPEVAEEVELSADTIILTDVTESNEPRVRIREIPEERRVELERLHKELPQHVTAEVQRQYERAMEQAQRAKAEADRAREHAEVQRAHAEVAAQKGRIADVHFRLARPMEMEKASFLGIGGSPVTEVLREHLKLPKGIGIVVEGVEPDSPAQKAGVERFDILHKLNDQLIVNTHQLAVLVRSIKSGETVKLTVIRGGEPKVLEATLVEKELRVLSDADNTALWDIPPLPPAPPAPGNPFAAPGMPPAPPPRPAFRGFGGEGAGFGGFPGHSGSVARIVRPDGKQIHIEADGAYNVRVSEKDGKRHVAISDQNGNKLFDGPFDTAEDRDKLPPELKGKVRVLEMVDPAGRKPALWLTQPHVKVDTRVETIREARTDKQIVKERDGERTERQFKAIEFTDDDHQLRVELKDGKKTLTARDGEGKELFKGPIDTAEQRKALPEEIRDKLDSSRWQSIMRELEG